MWKQIQKKIEIQKIIATNETIHRIVEEEIEKYGLNADLNHIDVSNVTDMSGMFGHSEFKGNINDWNVSEYCSTFEMFKRSVLEKNNNLPTWYEAA